VKVPKVYWRYTSPRVLTLEYLPGIKISHYEALEAAGLDRKLLAKLGAKAYSFNYSITAFFTQILTLAISPLIVMAP